jgi:hypothetical protein
MTTLPIHKSLVKKVEHVRRQVKLGRLAAPDARDFHVGLVMPKGAIVIVSRTWSFSFKPHLDQGSVSACVGYSGTNLLLASPVIGGATTAGVKRIGGQLPNEYALDLYHGAQLVDEWPGENYEGTSVRAGAKVLQSQGRLQNYYFAHSAAEARDFLIQFGPVQFGTNWYERMFTPDANGYCLPEGNVAGGHAYLGIGYSKSRKAFRILNQWKQTDPTTGKLVEWGEMNRAWIHEEHVDRLIAEDGECLCPTELKLA